MWRGYKNLKQDRRATIGILATALLLSFLTDTHPAKADPCADGVSEVIVGEDGGWYQDGLLFPDVLLNLPRGGGTYAQSTDVFSLGANGSVTLEFSDNIIVDGPGVDFIVFENAFQNSPAQLFREAGYVEASQDGNTFYRFAVTGPDGQEVSAAHLLATPTFDSSQISGLAGITPVFTHPSNSIDPQSPEAGGNGFDLAAIGLEEVRFIRVVDAGETINDEGNHFPIRGQGKQGVDLDTIIGVHSRDICADCCDAVYNQTLESNDLLQLLKIAEGGHGSDACGAPPCAALACGDTDADHDIDNNDAQHCLSRILGSPIPCASGLCDLSSTQTASLPFASEGLFALENPPSGSTQSGIGILSGWKCSAGKITARFDHGESLEVAYGTPRGDTAAACSDINNAFVMLWNYGNLSDGTHTLRLYDDGLEFASRMFRTQRLGQDFLDESDTTGITEFLLADFPGPNSPQDIRVGWQTASQSFGIIGFETSTTKISIPEAQGLENLPLGNLEIPAEGSRISGIGLVSGWRCDAGQITAIFDDGDPLPVAYGTSRHDTIVPCGDQNNAYALQWNFGLLLEGPHTLRLLDDGVVFASRNFIVSGLGVPFFEGASGQYDLFNFPTPGAAVTIEWAESVQNFRTIAHAPADDGTSSTPCDGVLEVHLEILGQNLGSVITRLQYPENLDLPAAELHQPSTTRITFPSPVFGEINAFRNEADTIAIGRAATIGIPSGRWATLRFDCAGNVPALDDFQCLVDATDLDESAAATSCIVTLG